MKCIKAAINAHWHDNTSKYTYWCIILREALLISEWIIQRFVTIKWGSVHTIQLFSLCLILLPFVASIAKRASALWCWWDSLFDLRHILFTHYRSHSKCVCVCVIVSLVIGHLIDRLATVDRFLFLLLGARAILNDRATRWWQFFIH